MNFEEQVNKLLTPITENVEGIEELMARLKSIDHEQIHCAMSVIVLKDDGCNSGQKAIQTFVYGTDDDIVKMITVLTICARNSLDEPAPDEVRH